MADRVTFTRPAAERIGKVVRIVEAGDREASPYAVDVRLEERGTKLRLGLWTATTSWTVASVTGATTTNNTKVIQFAFPQQTASAGTTTVRFSVGPTALCVNHLVRINRLSTSTTSVLTITAFKEGGFWRLSGAEC